MLVEMVAMAEAQEMVAAQLAEEMDQLNQRLADWEQRDYFHQHFMEDSLEVEQHQQDLIDVVAEEADLMALVHREEMAVEETEDQEYTQTYLVHHNIIALEATELPQTVELDLDGLVPLMAQVGKTQQTDTQTALDKLEMQDATE